MTVPELPPVVIPILLGNPLDVARVGMQGPGLVIRITAEDTTDDLMQIVRQ